jgi:5-methylcytosine-specific restriction endonuclease McrA
MKERKRKYYPKLIEMVGECEQCGSKENLVVHHLVRLNMGGKDIPRNIQIVCAKCHRLIHFKEFNRK